MPHPIFEKFRFRWLFASMVAFLVLSPLSAYNFYGDFLLPLLFSLTLLTAVYAAAESKTALWAAIALAAPALVLIWLFDPEQRTPLSMIGIALTLALNLLVLSLVLVQIYKADRVDAEILSGALAVYLLMAMTWALLYFLIESLDPGSFKIPDGNDFPGFLYFSLTTLTTLGYGDITPATTLTRSWAVLEAVIGVLYSAVMIARLVSMYRR